MVMFKLSHIFFIVDTLEKNDSIEKTKTDYIRQMDYFTNDTEISSSKYSSNTDK